MALDSIAPKQMPETQSWLQPMPKFSSNVFERFPPSLDVVLVTHPRDDKDLPRLFPWSHSLNSKERITLIKCLRPVFGEIIRTSHLNVGIMFIPALAEEMLNPRLRSACREMLQHEALQAIAASGAKILCLGGLTGALTHYGKQIAKEAEALGITITTGHALTAISVFRTYLKAVEDLDYDPSSRQLAVLGLGSIGGAFSKLLVSQDVLPKSLLLIDRPSREDHLIGIAEELKSLCDIDIRFELTLADGTLRPDSGLYESSYIVSAVSTPNVLEIEKISPYTVLIDDSQPYCWPREQAMWRCRDRADIAPCEAGLVDCRSIGYISHFPFDFSDHGEFGSTISWSCLSEGLVRHLDGSLPAIIGEPHLADILRYQQAFDDMGLQTPALQCGSYELPISNLKAKFAQQ